METPLTPLEFARRARRLYPEREAVVDGALRLTYRQFFDRCDLWSAASQRLGVRPGDRVATSPQHARTSSPLRRPTNRPHRRADQLPADRGRRAFILNHSGARVVCAHADYLDTVDRIAQVEGRTSSRSKEGNPAGSTTKRQWRPLQQTSPSEIQESVSFPQLHRAPPLDPGRDDHPSCLLNVGNARARPPDPGDRYLWTVPMFHANGWTFVWIVTAVGGAFVAQGRASVGI